MFETFHKAVRAKGSARVVSELEWTFFMCHTSCLVESCEKYFLVPGGNMVELNPGANGRVNTLGLDFNSCVCVCLLGFRSSSKLATSSFFC